jgi:hypothetical protein
MSQNIRATAEPFSRAFVVPKLVANASEKAAQRYASFFAGPPTTTLVRRKVARLGLLLYRCRPSRRVCGREAAFKLGCVHDSF